MMHGDRRSGVRYLVVWALGLALIGCGDGYDVIVEFESEDLAAVSEHIVVGFVEDCSAQSAAPVPLVGATRVVEGSREGLPGLGEVPEGSYWLYARATNSLCQVVATGCESVTLEARGGGELSIRLVSVAGAGCSPGARCAAGQCSGGDGDADVDADADADADADQDCPDGTCDINGQCVAADALHPNSSCGSCDLDESADGWTWLSDESPCTDTGGAEGQCWWDEDQNFSECCSGCWTEMGCQDGDSNGACGRGGRGCVSCISDGMTCNAQWQCE